MLKEDSLVVLIKQKTADEISECDWSADVCAADISLQREKEMERETEGGQRQKKRKR